MNERYFVFHNRFYRSTTNLKEANRLLAKLNPSLVGKTFREKPQTVGDVSWFVKPGGKMAPFLKPQKPEAAVRKWLD